MQYCSTVSFDAIFDIPRGLGLWRPGGGKLSYLRRPFEQLRLYQQHRAGGCSTEPVDGESIEMVPMGINIHQETSYNEDIRCYWYIDEDWSGLQTCFNLQSPLDFRGPGCLPVVGCVKPSADEWRDALSQRQMISMFRHRTIGTIWYYWFLRMGARLQHHNVPM